MLDIPVITRAFVMHKETRSTIKKIQQKKPRWNGKRCHFDI